MKCPNCLHEWKDPARVKGGKARLANLTKTTRSKIMKKVRAARTIKQKQQRKKS